MATQIQSSPGIPDQLQNSMAVSPEKPTIPVVTHIITDEDIGSLTGSRLQPVNMNKVIKLLTDPHSSMLYDRHVHMLQKVVNHYQKGFLMKDLVLVFRMLNICADRIDEQPMYIRPMCELLRVCALPFLRERSSDEIAFEQIAVESVSQLGYLMRVPSAEVRRQICSTLISFYSDSSKSQDVQRHKSNTNAYNCKIVEKSDVSEILVKSLSLVEDDIQTKIEILRVLQCFSKDSQATVKQMLRAEAAHRLCSRLNEPDPSGQSLFRSVEILWNLHDNGDRKQLYTQLRSLICVSQLQEAFVKQLTQGYSHYDRQLRNDLLVLSTLILAYKEDVLFLEAGFAKQLALLASFQEVKSHHPLVKQLKLGTSHEDFELKKLLINAIVLLSRDQAALPILSESHVVLALFSYVRANEPSRGPREWTSAQFEEIQLHSLAALCTLCPLLVEDYVTCQGSTRLLLLLEWCASKDDAFAGHGNSFHGSGGRGNKRAQMRHCLRLLRSMVSLGDQNLVLDLSDQGAIHQLTSQMYNSVLGTSSRGSGDDDSIDIEMQTDMLYILSAICEGDMHRKELFGQKGVEVLISYLKMDVKNLSSGLGQHKLLLATLDCIWCAVVGCYLNEDYFMEKHGIFLLIDLLQSCPQSMRNLALGCLLDLAENTKAASHIATWRGTGGQTAPHLLCSMWRSEEQEMGVQRAADGTIVDVLRPLAGQVQVLQGVTPLPTNCPSQAIVDVSENMRAKIYALFYKLGFTELQGLTTEDQVTVVVIEKYLDFKLGEVWTEVMEELSVEGVRPITPDQEALETISRVIADSAQDSALLQRQLIDAAEQQEQLSEQQQFNEIRENFRQRERAISKWDDYVARTSNYGYLREAKEKQEQSVDASRIVPKLKDGETVHKLDLPKMNVTALSRRHQTVNSTPLEITGGFLCNVQAGELEAKD